MISDVLSDRSSLNTRVAQSVPSRHILFLFPTVLWFMAPPMPENSATGAPTHDPHRETVSQEEIVAILTDTLTSLDSLYCEWTQIRRIQGQIDTTKRCRYARSGKKWHNTEFSVDDNGVIKENIVCFDGEQAYAYHVTRSPDGSATYGTVEVQDSQGESLLTVEYLIGMRLPSLRRSLPDVFRSIAPTQITTANEGDLFELRLTGVPNSVRADGKVYAYDITCDVAPKYGMLPTQIHAEFASDTKSFAQRPSWSQRWRIENFALVEDELSKTVRWFPFRGILEQSTGKDATPPPAFELLLTTVRLNPPLDEHFFTPAVPDGTTLVDSTSRGRGRVTLAGRGTSVDRRVTKLAEVAGRAGGGSSLLVWLLLGNAIVFALIAFIFLRSRRT